MKTVEYGHDNRDVIVLLHGGGLSWWQYQAVAERLSGQFHVVLPILPGHAGSDSPFTTMEDAAQQVIRHIDQAFQGHVLLLGGLSLGGQVAVEVLSRRPDICDAAFIESALAFPMRITAALTGPAFSLCYPLIRQRWFARLQFWQLHMPPELFEAYFRDTARIRREDMIAFLRANAAYRLREALSLCRANVLVTAGNREIPVMKRSAKAISAALPSAGLHILPGMQHGDLSMRHPDQYVQLLLHLTDK